MPYAYTNGVVRSLAYIIDAIGGALFSRRAGEQVIDRGKIRRIVVLKLDQLGDCFLMTPLFRYLAEGFPSAAIDVVCQEAARPIFENNPCIAKIITFNCPRIWRGVGKRASVTDTIDLVLNLRKQRYEVAIDPRGVTFAGMTAFLAGMPYRLGFEKEEAGGFFYTHAMRYCRDGHETEKYKILLKTLDISAREWKPEVCCTDSEKARACDMHKALFSRPVIAIHISAGLPHKMWPLESFAKLITMLGESCNCDFALLGSQNDAAFAQGIREALNKMKVEDLTGKLSIREAYLFLSGVKCFIGNDSVLAHFAGSHNVPTIELMNGSIAENRWKALGRHVQVISGHDREHRCLLDKCGYPCPNMKAISVEEVFDSVTKLVS